MSWGSGELVGALAFLLPGFVSAAIYHALTSHPKPSAFERVIQALIFTAIVQAIVTPLPSSVRVTEVTLGAGVMWDPLWSTGLAVLVALVVVVAVNNDAAHAVLRRLRIGKFGVTWENSYPSSWYSAFFRNVHRNDCYVVLYLTRKRRLYGWAAEWSNDPADGHIRITEGEWLEGGENGAEESPESLVEILIPVRDVEMVEFIEGIKQGQSEE